MKLHKTAECSVSSAGLSVPAPAQCSVSLSAQHCTVGNFGGQDQHCVEAEFGQFWNTFKGFGGETWTKRHLEAVVSPNNPREVPRKI